ncbi:MAG: nucleoside triphosphate pyrophosphohydrolase [Ilumatobacteraceae bacterium]|jgi:tetrapyrrole methylase family protein/MazG family protein|nr:nucleoside triphosphate pyrophosphohydrolase [Ilumatobacteraceae bacterium]
MSWAAFPEVVVVGLGPGGREHVTAEALELIAAIPHRYLRTSVHPTAHLVPDARSFDHVYEAADTFDDVYERIADDLVAAAHEHGRVLYAVPGSPLVLERTVRRLLADDRVACDVRPAMSFLDVAWARLGIDPVEAGVRLVDGHEFATAAAGERGPLLVAHVHADWVLSEIKLAVDDLDGSADDDEVVILQALGTPDERIERTTWSELDRTVAADHLTTLYLPRLSAPVGAEYVRFHRLARTLREQCPWDIEQTHRSLVPYLLEETYEVVDALQALDPDDPATDDALVEELGDLLYQIEFHATIAEQEGRFTIADVARGIHDKLVRRHPHVFGDVDATDTATVLGNWESIKRAEKQRTSVFDGVPTSMPALSYAHAVQRKAAKVGFDWPDVDGALPKIAEEADEVMAARADGGDVAGELGDLLFAVVNVARHLGVDPELALRAATAKFRERFEAVERLAAARGLDVGTAGLAVLDALWDEVKRSAAPAPPAPPHPVPPAPASGAPADPSATPG